MQYIVLYDRVQYSFSKSILYDRVQYIVLYDRVQYSLFQNLYCTTECNIVYCTTECSILFKKSYCTSECNTSYYTSECNISFHINTTRLSVVYFHAIHYTTECNVFFRVFRACIVSLKIMCIMLCCNLSSKQRQRRATVDIQF